MNRFTIYEDSYRGSDQDYHYVSFGYNEHQYEALIEYDPKEDFFCLSRIKNESGQEIWNLIKRSYFEEEDIATFESLLEEIVQAAVMKTFNGFEKIKIDTLETNSDGTKKAVFKVVIDGIKFWMHYKKGINQEWAYEGGLGSFTQTMEEMIAKEALAFNLDDLERYETIA